MVRLGTCPTVVKRQHFRPARVTVCLVVFIPNELGYYTHRFEVMKLCLRSLIANTPDDGYDLMVLDNGSCRPVVDYLQTLKDQGHIDFLFLLKSNIGKLNACSMMFQAAPGDVIAYSDDDVFFEPNWLGAQLELLDAYPRVGMVSARPVRKQFEYGNRYLPTYLTEFPDVTAEYGHFIPDAWEIEFLRSTGRSVAELESIRQSCTDILLEYRGVKAYSTAAHFQFLTPRPIILEGFRLGASRVIGSEERRVEEAIDELGYARLSTFGRHVRHIGNVISADLLAEVGSTLPATGDLTVWTPPTPLPVRMARTRLVRALLRRVNRWSYLLLYHPDP